MTAFRAGPPRARAPEYNVTAGGEAGVGGEASAYSSGVPGDEPATFGRGVPYDSINVDLGPQGFEFGQPWPKEIPYKGQKKSLLDGMSSAERKEYPVTTGCLDYFRDALLAVSNVSYHGNQKHNPGQPLHWARGKSADEADAMGRHLLEREELDGLTEEVVAANLAWRALAYLQKVLEAKYNIEPPRGCS
jgi:hypothetical protein